MKYKYRCIESNEPDIFKLRYEVYVKEKHYIEESTDALDKMIEDELDKDAHIFGVYFEEKLIASARYNCTLNGSKLEALEMFPEYHKFLENKCNTSYKDLSFIEISRIVVDKDYRNTYAIPILFFEIFEHAVEKYDIDGMVYKIRESEKALKSLYLNFNCKILENSIKEVKPYRNKGDVKFMFGYMLINELDLNFSDQKIYKVLEHFGGDDYVRRIRQLKKAITNNNKRKVI